ncbi:unnamed protein product [Penicillium nalgiovense]|uniref:Uncharacterized protein n=1 Tax=Penicillium nalgiovense TaxID=60175 RepID=A0A9W4HLK8_PENNA|nr:unnamed protein product [Penicillium nalgiovense]CAG7995404.1 unnamed protein product [Penicillium nalgiovense]CAG8019046.1 unnamed protein product [Penicillium nalgiovense]CAG8028402.1 unnamed protein product [Penicillium nalgiovense]CAG8043372.1 unnamed protein product [Penicillium nalgiovense]
MSNNRPFLANFLAAFRAQSTYKPTQQVGTTSLSSAQISQSARTIATKAANSAQGSSAPSSASATAHHNHNHNHNNHTHTSSSSATTAPPGPVQGPSPAPSHHYHHDQSSVPSTPPSSTPIPINRDTPDRQRRGSDSSSGSGGFRDATGPEKWYIGGRTPAGEERFYRLGMVTKGGGRLGGSGRVGSIDQLSL